jgi:hypothetical protein
MAKSGIEKVLEVAIALGLSAAAITAIKRLVDRYREERSGSVSGFRGLGASEHDSPRGRMVNVRTLDERIALLNEVAMVGRADPKVIMLTRKAVSQRCGDSWCIAERDHHGEVRAVFDEARRSVRYTADPIDVDTFATPGRALEGMAEDCDGQAALLAAMLGSIGYPTKWRVIQTNGAAKRGHDWDHIYLLVGTPPDSPTEWHALDLSEPHEAGWEVPMTEVARVRDFPVPLRG